MQSMPGMDMRDSAKSVSMPSDDMKDMPGMDMSHATPAQAKPAAMRMMPGMHMVAEPTLDLSTTAIWGRTRSLADNSKENSYLLEALLRFAGGNYAWTRMENAGRSNELLLDANTPLPPNFQEEPIGHVATYTFGCDHDVKLGSKIFAAPGAQFTLYRTPAPLISIYGSTPTAETFFVRFRLR